MRHPVLLFAMLLALAGPASAQVTIGIGLPGLSIDIHVPTYPTLERIPSHPVYDAPGLRSIFFFDGMYWVYVGDEWYASDWYNGPWGLVPRRAVPLYLLRVPVRYDRSPPSYFRGWRPEAPPQWGVHWGPSWQQQREGWDRWDRRAAPAPAPLPTCQRQYRADRYPQGAEQRASLDRNYRYPSRDEVVRQHRRGTPAPVVSAPTQLRPARPVDPPGRPDPVRATPAPRPPVPATPATSPPRDRIQVERPPFDHPQRARSRTPPASPREDAAPPGPPRNSPRPPAIRRCCAA